MWPVLVANTAPADAGAGADISKPLVLVGPEGGWSDEETTFFAEQGIARYRLGSTILRAETMPAVALALIQQVRGWPH